MLFHRFVEINTQGVEVRGTQDLGVGARPGKRELQMQPDRVWLAIVLPALLGVAAITSYAAGFQAGATTFLHLTEVAVGAIVGSFFGERAAAQSLA